MSQKSISAALCNSYKHPMINRKCRLAATCAHVGGDVINHQTVCHHPSFHLENIFSNHFLSFLVVTPVKFEKKTTFFLGFAQIFFAIANFFKIKSVHPSSPCLCSRPSLLLFLLLLLEGLDAPYREQYKFLANHRTVSE